jgi:hypothetical protein
MSKSGPADIIVKIIVFFMLLPSAPAGGRAAMRWTCV